MIMLRERRTTGTTRTSDGDCDCGILSDVLDGLNKVVEDDAVVAAGEEADIFASHEEGLSPLGIWPDINFYLGRGSNT